MKPGNRMAGMPNKVEPPDAAFFDSILDAAEARPRPPKKADIESERVRCAADPVYFINTYVKIYDSVAKAFIPFKLWPAQEEALRLIIANKFVQALKARQLGITWIGVAYTLWQMLFDPIAEVLIFSQRDDEAMSLLQRIKDSYAELPDWMKQPTTTNSEHEFRLRNGSGATAFPAKAGGRSKTSTFVMVDEADFVEKLEALIAAAKPTVDAGDNKMLLVSTVNDETPNSYFRRLYKAAQAGDSQWVTLFIPWYAHPSRTREWYEREKEDSYNTFGTLDKFYKEYPETPEQALAPRELNKRFPPQWVSSVTAKRPTLPLPIGAPVHNGFVIYEYPIPGRQYGVGADSSGGKTDSDPAVAQVVDAETKRQVAKYAGHVEPETFGGIVADIAEFFNNALINFELNNHGHAVRIVLKQRGANLKLGLTKQGPSKNPGWLTTDWAKAYMYDRAVEVVQQIIEEARQAEEQPVPIIFDTVTSMELSSISIDEENYLKAPEGEHDDHAVAWALAQVCVYRATAGVSRVSHDMYDTLAAPVSAPAEPGRRPALPVTRADRRSMPAALTQAEEAAVRRKLRERGLL